MSLFTLLHCKKSFKTLEIELHTCSMCSDTPHLVSAWFVFQNIKMCFKKRKVELHKYVRCCDILYWTSYGLRRWPNIEPELGGEA